MRLYRNFNIVFEDTMFDTHIDMWQKVFAHVFTFGIKYLGMEDAIRSMGRSIDVSISTYHPAISKIKYALGWTFWNNNGLDSVEVYFPINLPAEEALLSLMDTVFHELIHVHQVLRGDLASTGTKMELVWRGKMRNAIDPANPDSPYEEQPWEKEAYSGAFQMMKDYFATNRKLAGLRGTFERIEKYVDMKDAYNIYSATMVEKRS